MSKERSEDEWESPPPSPKPEAPRPKLAVLPQELRKGARNIQFVLEEPHPVPPASPSSPKSERKPPPIPDKPTLTRRESFMDNDAPQPTLNTKPVPPPKPVSKRMSIDASSMQEVSKAFAEEENGRVDEADKKNNRKSLGGTFSGRNLKDRIDSMANSPPPLTLSSPGKETRQEPTTAASPGPETKERKKGSSLSSSIKALLPKSRSTSEKPPLASAFDSPVAEDKTTPAGRHALAQSLSLPATSPRPGGSAAPLSNGLRTSVQNVFGRKESGEENSDGTNSAPGSVPGSPRSLSNSLEDASESFPTWDSVPTPEHLLNWRPPPASPPSDSLPPLITLSENSLWRIEPGWIFADEKDAALHTATSFNYAEDEYHYYAEGIFPHEHTTWVTTGPEDPMLGPLVLSLESIASNQKSARILMRSRTGDTRITFPITKGAPRDVLRAFTEENPQYEKLKWKETGDEELEKELLDMERKAVKLLKSCKIGVLFCLDNQKDESEMLRNRESTPAFDEFLELLGDKVELLGFDGYNGGLDTSKNKTGTHSVYTSFEGHSLMWHVSTLLPFYPDDAQQLERKRHLGNDVVTLVFKEGNTPFNPACLTSQFTHAVCVVQKVENSTPTQYRVAFSYRNGCRPHTPLLTHPCIYTKGPDFKRFLLTKLVNAERAAFHAPAFAEKLSKMRLLMLRELVIKAASSVTVPRQSGRSVIGKAGSVIAAPLVSALPLVSPKRNTGGSRLERPLATDRMSTREPQTGEPLTAVRSSEDNLLMMSASGSRISRAGLVNKDREKELERERKEKEKQDKEREKAEKKERERQEKEKKKDEKEREKLEKDRLAKEKLAAPPGSKEPTPRTEDPRAMNCLWIDKLSEFSPLLSAWGQANSAILFKTFVSLDELTVWLSSREGKLKGLDFRVVFCRGRDTDVAEVEALVSWVRFSSPVARSKILIFTSTPAGLEFLASPKRTYVSADATFCQQFATFKFNDV